MARGIAFCLGVVLLSSLLVFTSPSPAAGPLSKGQTIYVPIYSHVVVGPKALPIDMGARLSIRNTDQARPITVLFAKYYNSDGQFIRNYLKKPVTLKPLATTSSLVDVYDKTGGSGANFIVKWESAKAVNPPVVEAVHISWKGQLGISFLTSGRVLSETAP
ncbi:MAG: DUF3124 domain-containing protein [Deltaproteobacteria bacterium]